MRGAVAAVRSGTRWIGCCRETRGALSTRRGDSALVIVLGADGDACRGMGRETVVGRGAADFDVMVGRVRLTEGERLGAADLVGAAARLGDEARLDIDGREAGAERAAGAPPPEGPLDERPRCAKASPAPLRVTIDAASIAKTTRRFLRFMAGIFLPLNLSRPHKLRTTWINTGGQSDRDVSRLRVRLLPG